MYSPVFLSRPTTSGSPPVLSISLRDHSFSVLASSLAWTSAHARPLWRFMFFSKRALSAPSSSLRFSGSNSFLFFLSGWGMLLRSSSIHDFFCRRRRPVECFYTELLGVFGVQSLPAAELYGIGSDHAANGRFAEQVIQNIETN